MSRIIRFSLVLFVSLSMALPASYALSGTGAVQSMPARTLFGQIIKEVQALGLTDDQKKELKQIFLDNKTEIKDLLKADYEARKRLVKAIHAPKFNEGAVRSASAQVAHIEADLAVRRAELVEESRAVLTDEQQNMVQKDLMKLETFIDHRIEAVKSLIEKGIQKFLSRC